MYISFMRNVYLHLKKLRPTDPILFRDETGNTGILFGLSGYSRILQTQER